MKSATCAKCGEEVRHGYRNGHLAWLHREAKDHLPMFGRLTTPEERQTALEAWDLRKAAEGLEEEAVGAMEPIEVPHTDLDLEDEAVPGGLRQVARLALKHGWTLHRLSYARGPYVAATGKSLGLSDSHVLVVRGRVDGTPALGVASYRDGSADWAWRVTGKYAHRCSVTDLKKWIKEHPHGADAGLDEDDQRRPERGT